MKKFICLFVLYIGFGSWLFKAVPAVCSETRWTDDEFYIKSISENQAEQLAKAEEAEEKLSTLDRVEYEIKKFIMMPFVVDSYYKGEEINGDISEVLYWAWPKASPTQISMLSSFIRNMVALKRRYVYVVDRLQKKIGAANLFPTDSPIVAKDGEFAPKYTDQRKETGADEYKVSYHPYKYLEYDTEEYGEPVRRRDKNYEAISSTTYDEVILALLKFDLAGFYDALKKMPLSNDGTREKPNELGDGVRSRLLLATKSPGDLETIEGVIEVYVPQGWYINGDYFNPEAKPQFFLSEDNKDDLNIKSYKIQYPLANGVISQGRTQRLWTGDVRFPIEISRRDVDKPMHVRGTFTFQLCKQNSFECRFVASHNALSLEPSVKEYDSVHSNFVRQSFVAIPREKSAHVELTKAFYEPSTGNLTLKFKTSRPFNNVAAMVEDKRHTDFINPKYHIAEDEITVTFESQPYAAQPNAGAGASAVQGEVGVGEGLTNEIAVSASFDDREALRKVVEPEIFMPIEADEQPQTPNYWLAFLFGILLNVMPAALCLLQRIYMLFKEKEQRRMIFYRYALGTALGLALLGGYISTHLWYLMYGCVWLNVAAIILSVSYLSVMLGYMDFNLFRPFKGKLRRGFLMGLSTILFMAAFPYVLKTDVLSRAPVYNQMALLGYLAVIWLGILVLPLLGLIFNRYIIELPLKLRYINVPYTIFYILGVLMIAWNNRGIGALILMLFVSVIILLLWYIYPLLVSETIGHRRAMGDKVDLFMKVQNYCAVVLAGIFVLTVLVYRLIPQTIYKVPLPAEEIVKAQQAVAQGQEVLITFNADWQQPLALENRLRAQGLQTRGMMVRAYRVPTHSSMISEWFKMYNHYQPPLNILFTQRHPNGLVLPGRLKKINWGKAIQNFE